MNILYTNLLDNLPAFFGLFIAGIWLLYKSILIAYKVNIFQQIALFISDREIILPSFIFLASPFIATFIYNSYIHNNFDGFIKNFTPIACITAYIAYQQYQLNKKI